MGGMESHLSHPEEERGSLHDHPWRFRGCRGVLIRSRGVMQTENATAETLMLTGSGRLWH